MVIKWVSRPNKEKYAYRHTCPFIILPYVVTYPLNSLLIFLEQFCHPLSNEFDHCVHWKVIIKLTESPIFFSVVPFALWSKIIISLFQGQISRSWMVQTNYQCTPLIPIKQNTLFARFVGYRASIHLDPIQMVMVKNKEYDSSADFESAN